ncbi:MAG: glycosyltransferase family 2 protein [Nanoarchaeota archaeon]|nr:glycosyltransferase family 2 protein [Nanoarchaeota archaeon]
MITTIISAHNEEKNIRNILKDVIRELNNLNEKSELIISLSGCNDRTEEFAKDEIKNSKLDIKIFKTPKGKIKSQRKTLNKINRTSEFIIFIDCDIRLKKNALKNMIKDAKKYPDVKLFYSTEIPIKRNNILYKIINVRTINPEYVIAKEEVSDFHPYSDNKRKKVFATGGMYLVRKGIYDVDGKAIGDDSYLTHSIYHRFGFGTIKQTEDAIIYYQPVYTFSSWIKKWRRIWSDIENLYLNHPEFKYLEEYMVLRIDFRKLAKEKRIKLMLCFLLERIWNKFGGFVFKKFLLKKGKNWSQLYETKEVDIL